MISRARVRDGASIASAVVFTLSAASAVAQAPKVTARYSATTASLNAGSDVNVSIDILRWSTDEEAGKLITAFKDKSDKWTDALDEAPSVGYVWTANANLGYSVKLAREIRMPDGGSRVILAVTPTLGSWDRPAWKAAAAQATDYPFTVIELRLNKAGVGGGKASLAAKVVVEEAAKAVVLENYAAAPILLKGVKPRGAAAAPPASPASKPGSTAKPASGRGAPKPTPKK